MDAQVGSFTVKKGHAQMLKGGVIMDVVTPEHARIAEEAGACAVMALERVPADIRAHGGVARMSDPELILQIMDTVTIPVMAKCRIGHFVEAQILEAIGVDYIDESEVLTPADEAHHINKHAFKVPFVCGCRNLGEALRRIGEGAAMIRTKGEAGTGDVVEAVRHARAVLGEIRRLQNMPDLQRRFSLAGSQEGGVQGDIDNMPPGQAETRQTLPILLLQAPGYLAREGYTSSDISKALITPFAEKTLPKVLTRAEYTRLLAACAENPRDLAIITLFLQTGIKLSELVCLKVADIELAGQAGENNGWLKVQEGSGRKGRVLPLNQKAGEALRTYLLVRGKPDVGTLFLNRAGELLGSRGVQKVIEKYMGKAGIKGASVHSLRHTFGTHHAAKGTSIKTIQKVMGHKDSRTTEMYLDLAKDIQAKELEENAL